MATAWSLLHFNNFQVKNQIQIIVYVFKFMIFFSNWAPHWSKRIKPKRVWRRLANTFGVLRMSEKKSLNKNRIQKPSDSKTFPRKRVWIVFFYCAETPNGAHSQTHSKFDYFMKRMSNKKIYFFSLSRNEAANAQKIDKAICHWELSNIFVVFVINVRNMLMKTHNDDKKRHSVYKNLAS